MKTLISLLALLSLFSSALADSVTLAWDANPAGQNVTGYVLYEQSGATLTKVGETTTATTLTLKNVTDAAHSYVVKAKNVRGEGPASSAAGVPALPGAPANLRVVVEVTVKGP